MRATLLIAARELRDRRAVLAAAAVAGVLPFASPLLPGVSAAQAAEARDVMAAVLALGFGLVLTTILGASAVGRDLFESRLGFDFARPVGTLSIWGGRFAAALALVVAAIVVVAAPAAIAAGRLPFPEWEFLGVAAPVLTVLGAILLLLPLAHAGGVALRSRSAWLALDLVAGVVVLLLGIATARRLHDAFAIEAAVASAVVAIVATIPALWIASAAQLVRGRTDPVKGHRALSLWLWTLLLALSVAYAGYGAWFLGASPDDLVAAQGQGAPAGDWVAIQGAARGRGSWEAGFLLDPATGRSVAIGGSSVFGGPEALFSADGHRAVVLRAERPAGPSVEALVVDLDAPVPVPRSTTLSFSLLGPLRFALSPAGRRLAAIESQTLAVHDLDDGRVLAAVRVSPLDQDWGRTLVSFRGEERVRVYVLGDRLVVHEFDVPSRRLASFEGAAIEPGYRSLRWRDDHERLLLTELRLRTIDLLDGRSGARIARLAESRQRVHRSARFLADGRIAIVDAPFGERATLRVFSPEGLELRAIDLGRTGNGPLVGAEIAPGRLAVGFGRPEPPLPARPLFLVDVETGTTRETDHGVWPMAGNTWIPGGQPVQPGSAAARLVTDGAALWLLDPSSLELQRVAGGG